jgi:hypothetical protein
MIRRSVHARDDSVADRGEALGGASREAHRVVLRVELTANL